MRCPSLVFSHPPARMDLVFVNSYETVFFPLQYMDWAFSRNPTLVSSHLTYFLRNSFSFSIVMTLLPVLSSTRAVGPFVSLIVPT